jgi:hypothetical protein
VRMWDVNTGQEVQRFGAVDGRGGYGDTVTQVVAGADGGTLFSAGLDGTLRIFPLSVDMLLTWVGEHRYVRAFSCDERLQFRIEPLCVEATQNP